MTNSDRSILITGAAGFVGFHLALRLLREGKTAVALDNLSDYYDVNLKKARLERLTDFAAFSFHHLDLADRGGMERLFLEHNFETVVHLAAQAGVRYSLTNPHSYVERPDMALFLFTRGMLAGQPIQVFNQGMMERDFTYIDDIIEGIVRVMARPARPNPRWRSDVPDAATSCAAYRIYNIGSHRPLKLLDFIATLEECLGLEAKKEFLPLQPGDVPCTCADIEDLVRDFGFRPQTSVREGISQFVKCYQHYYRP